MQNAKRNDTLSSVILVDKYYNSKFWLEVCNSFSWAISVIVLSCSAATEIIPLAENKCYDKHFFPCYSNCQPSELCTRHICSQWRLKDMLPLGIRYCSFPISQYFGNANITECQLMERLRCDYEWTGNVFDGSYYWLRQNVSRVTEINQENCHQS
jgi:hypothetical protein